MASQEIIIGEEQLLITDKGEVIKAKELLDYQHNLIQWDNDYISAEIDSVDKVSSNLVTILGAQGRTLQCSESISFTDLSDNSINISDLKNEIHNAKVFRYWPKFGDISLNSFDIDLLGSSLSNQQYKRPNHYLKQTIPLYLSKLTKNSLSRLIDIMFKNGYMKHLDQKSKDLLIILLSKLGIYFDGQPKQSSDNITGSIKLCKSKLGVNFNKTKKESIRYLTEQENNAIKISFKTALKPVIGSFICQIN